MDTLGLRLMSLLGLGVMLLAAWGFSENRRRVRWRMVIWGVALQAGIGLLALRTPLKGTIFTGMSHIVASLNNASLAGSEMVFGRLADQEASGFILAFQGLTVILLVAAITAMLYHLRVIQAAVRGVAWCMRRTLKTSGAETLAAALLIFLGIESLTAVRTYLARMTRSELCAIMTTFMATIAGSVMVVYSGLVTDDAGTSLLAGHLLVASLMSAPAAIVVAKLLVPETVEAETASGDTSPAEVESHNLFDAAAQGTKQGLQLALNVAALIIVFVALVRLADIVIAAVTPFDLEAGQTPLATMTGWALRPVAALLGVPWEDAGRVGALLGTKTVLNEFVAFLQLRETTEALRPRSFMIASYALCGFANPGSLGILIAGISALAPNRQKDVTELGLRAFLGGTLACFMTACVAGVLTHD